MSQSSTVRNPALPFLPGFTVVDPTKQNFAKSHAFDVRKGVAVFEGAAPGIGGTLLPGQERAFKAGAKTRSFAAIRGVGSDTTEPSFIAFDRKVLRFFAYFQEGVVESRVETYRVRRVKIYYYLEDDSIQVNEEKQDNAGIPQGVLLKRHQVPKADDPADHYTFEAFNLGTEITLYGITYMIVNCDDFTKNFLEQAGITLNAPGEYPVDPFSVRQAESRPHPRMTVAPDAERLALRQFLSHDREVLRFFARWNNSDEPFGDDRSFVIHYFLSDDTVEVREQLPPNSGYSDFPVFARRQRMPRAFNGPPDSRAPASQTITDADLCVGQRVMIFNRDFFIYDADAFTKEHLKRRFGKTDAELAAIELPKEVKVVAKREIPPHMGIGSEEDTMGSVTHLFPKPPKKDFQKLLANDQRVYRFMARFEDAAPQDAERRFVISAYLGDDTIAVFEPPLRNSGIIGGKFLERRRFKKDASMDDLKPGDIHVGEVLVLGGHRFRVLDADDRTVHDQLAVRRGGELQRPITDLISTFPPPPPPVPTRNRALGEAPVCDVAATLGKIKDVLSRAGVAPADVVRQCEVRGDEQIQVAALRRCLVEYGVPMTEEMVLALADEFDPTGTTFMTGQDFVAAIEAAAPVPCASVPPPASSSAKPSPATPKKR